MGKWTWSETSDKRLTTCNPLLQGVCNMALQISPFDLIILCGHRTEAEQDAAYREGRSELQWPASCHNDMPSSAVDVAPYPLDWQNAMQFHVLAGVMFSAASITGLAGKGHKLRWGGDWNGNWSNRDQTFHDLPHFELRSL